MPSLSRLLFPTDLSSRADAAMSHAVFMAKLYGADLYVLHVVEDEGEDEDELLRAQQEIEARIASIRADIDGPSVIKVDVRRGEAAAPVVCDYAEEVAIDLIVISTHGRRGVRRMFLGSVAEEIIRAAPCHVYTIRFDDELPAPRPPRRIVVPIDFSEFGARTLRAARRIAVDEGEYHLIHAVEEVVPPGVYGLEYPSYHELSAEIEKNARAEMESMVSGQIGEGGTYRVVVRTGYAPSVITSYAEEIDADLIVVSSHGRSGFERWLLGSVAEQVIRTAEGAVLTVRAQENQS